MKDLFGTRLLILCTNMAFDLQSERTYRQSVTLTCLFRKYCCRDVTFSWAPIIPQNSIFKNSRRRADQYSWSRCVKVSRIKVDGIPFVGSYLSMLPNVLPVNRRVIIHTIQRTVVAATAHGISVSALGYLSFVCFRASPAKRRKNDVYERKLAKRKTKKFYSFPKLCQSGS